MNIFNVKKTAKCYTQRCCSLFFVKLVMKTNSLMKEFFDNLTLDLFFNYISIALIFLGLFFTIVTFLSALNGKKIED